VGLFDIRPRFYACYAGALLVLFPLHAAVHLVAYQALGIPVQATYFSVRPAAGFGRAPLAELAGPILNLTIALSAGFAYQSATQRRTLWAVLAVGAALVRLTNYVAISAAAALSGSGMTVLADESLAAHLWGLPSLLFVGALAVPFSAVTWSVVRTFGNSTIRRAGHLVTLAVLTQSLTIFAGNVFDRFLFPVGR
jgi:hypothetical protein